MVYCHPNLPISLTTAFKDELCKIVEIPSEISSKQGTEFLDEAAMFLHGNNCN